MRGVLLVLLAVAVSFPVLQCGDTATNPAPPTERPSLTGRWAGTLTDPLGNPSQLPLTFQFVEGDSTLTGTASIGAAASLPVGCLAWTDSLKLLVTYDTGAILLLSGVQHGYTLQGVWVAVVKTAQSGGGTWFARKQ